MVDELAFLVDPILKQYGGRMLADTLPKIAAEKDVINVSIDILDSAIEQATKSKDEKVNIFGVLIDAEGLSELKELIEKEIPDEKS